MGPLEKDVHDRVRAWIGTATMAVASIFAVLIFCDRMELSFLHFPPMWYTSRPMHFVACGAMFIAAAILLKSPLPKSQPGNRPLFGSCRVLTRKQCRLCDDAVAVLLSFQDALPTIEIVEIDSDNQLVRQFGESVPVVEIDGRIRFRGNVQPLLLKRLIDAAAMRDGQLLEQSIPDRTSGGVENRSRRA